MVMVLPIDPADLPTAQQKGVYKGHIFTKKKVKVGMRLVYWAAKPYVRLAPPKGTPVEVKVQFWFRIPKSRTDLREGDPVTSHTYGDLDNRVKAFQDSLQNAGFFSDDKDIARLYLDKVYTHSEPRIFVEINPYPDDSRLILPMFTKPEQLHDSKGNPTLPHRVSLPLPKGKATLPPTLLINRVY